MIKFKGLKIVDNIPDHGLYTKIAKTIIMEFQKSTKEKAEVEVEYEKPRELLSLYNAIKSLKRRKKYNPNFKVTIDRKKGKLYLRKI